MRATMLRGAISLVAICAGFAPAQDNRFKIPVQPTQADNGKDMYAGYCAPCHGLDGRGFGPRSSDLKTRAADLTMLSKNNNGAYPSSHVASVVKFGTKITVHGSKTMPEWGPALQHVDHSTGGNQATQALRVNNIVKYVETLQAK